MVFPSTGLVLTIWDPTEEEGLTDLDTGIGIAESKLVEMGASCSWWRNCDAKVRGSPASPLGFLYFIENQCFVVLCESRLSREFGSGNGVGPFMGGFCSAGVPRGTLSAEVEHQDVQVRSRDSTDAPGFAQGLGRSSSSFCLASMLSEVSRILQVVWNAQRAHGLHAVCLLLLFLDVAPVLDRWSLRAESKKKAFLPCCSGRLSMWMWGRLMSLVHRVFCLMGWLPAASRDGLTVLGRQRWSPVLFPGCHPVLFHVEHRPCVFLDQAELVAFGREPLVGVVLTQQDAVLRGW